VTVCDLLVWKRICAGFQLFAYVFITGEDPLTTTWRVGIPLTDVTLPYLCTCTIPEHGFPSEHVLTFYMFNDLRQEREVVVRFVDISWKLQYIRLWVRLLKPRSTIFQLYRGGQLYWWRKPSTCRKSLTNFIT
jgi:hypothetical protein